MDTTKMSADEYRALRGVLGWTQQKLATVLGIAMSTVSKRERGELEIDEEAALAIRRLADREPDEAA